MKKNLICIILLLLAVLAAAEAVSAQTYSPEEIKSTLSKAILREPFVNVSKAQYYRFAKSIWYYDNLALSYFPSEIIGGLKWEYIDNPGYLWFFNAVELPQPKDWALVMREDTGKVYKQMIYLDEPYEKDVFQGLDFPRVTNLSDFYLYTDLFITDEYPENTGSAYVYFSNSMQVGNRTSYGILIDPRDGIYRAYNNYDSFSTIQNKSAYSGTYLLGSEKHSLDLIEKLDPSLYEGKTGCIGSELFPAEDMDGKFAADLDALKTAAAKDGSSEDPAVYRIELVRLDGLTAIYINGVFVYEFKDNIETDGLTFKSARNEDDRVFRGIDLTTIEDELRVDEYTIRRFDDETWTIYDPASIVNKVSWTIGPRLYAGGETVTMAAGDVIIYGKQ